MSGGEIRVLILAFMISELRRGFEADFLIALRFLVIGMIVSTPAASTGMMMLPPPAITLSIKCPRTFNQFMGQMSRLPVAIR